MHTGSLIFRWLLLFTGIVLPLWLGAQPAVAQYSVNEGLSESTVTNILQDHKGYMWIGTGYGLNRFDGYSFTTYKNDPHNSNSISDNCIRGILEDTLNNVLWIGTENGLNKLDVSTGQFTNVLAGDNSFRKLYLVPFWLENNRVWFLTPDKGIFYYDIKNKKTEHVIKDRVSEEIYKGKISGEYWYVGQSRKLSCFSVKDRSVKTFDLPEELNMHPVLHVQPMDDNRMLICTYNGLFILNTITKEIMSRLPGDAEKYTRGKRIQHCRKDKQGNYWIAITNGGLYEFDNSWKLIRKYETEQNSTSHHSISFSFIGCLYNDRSDNIWVGTNDNGLCRINVNNIPFITGLKNTFIKCFYTDGSDRVWVGTFEKGFFVIDRANGTVKQVTKEITGLSSSTITFFFEDREGDLFVGTNNELALIDKRTFKATILKCDEPFCKLIQASCMQQASDGTLWLGSTSAGLHRLVRDEKDKFHLIPVGERPILISALYEDRKGNMIVASIDNFIGIASKNDIKKVFEFKENKLFRGNISVRSFAEDNNGNLWGATDIGLVMFSDAYKPVKIIDEHDGLGDNFIYGILKAQNGEFWISTNKGITRINPVTHKCRNYKAEDGLQSNEFNTGAYHQSRKGEFFFGGIDGYNSFFPGDVKDNPSLPAVTFDEFSVFDTPYESDTLAGEKRSFILPYNSNTVSFVLSALEYTDPSRNAYAYKLEGLDDDYFYSGMKRFVRYSGLAPGTYHFWAKAANADGVWSPPQKLFTLVITPPYWQTMWFRILMALLSVGCVALAVYLFMQARFRQQVRVLERQREIEQIRNRISKDIHDDIGAGLTRIALISEATRMEMKQQKDIDSRLQSLSGTAREMAESLREIVWSMNPVHDNLSSLLGFMRNYGHNFFEDLDISINMHFPEKPESEEVSPELRRNLFMITKEAFNNIAKHAGANKVDVSFSTSEKMFEMKISDDGTGFSINETKQFSNGLMNMKKRADEIKCSFEVESMKGKGTTITLKGKLS